MGKYLWTGMPVVEFKRLRKEVKSLAKELGLKEWQVDLFMAPIPEEESKGYCAADIKIIEGQKVGIIRLAVDFAARSKKQKRQTLVHELIHCHLSAMHHTIDLALAEAMEESTHSLLQKVFTEQLEHACEALAQAWDRK